MIKAIKVIHTFIWAIMASAIFYILYAGITKTFNAILWLSVGLILIETAVLIINKWACPLTPAAMKFTSDRRENFDIYLPEWLAKNNKLIFSILFVIGLFLIAYHFIRS